MQATEVKVVGFVEDPDTYPVAAKRHTFEYLRTVSHLRTRTNTFAAVARVRDCLSQAVHRYFHDNKFLCVHTPIVTASDCEGAGEMFRVTTFEDNKAPVNEEGEIDYTKEIIASLVTGKPFAMQDWKVTQEEFLNKLFSGLICLPENVARQISFGTGLSDSKEGGVAFRERRDPDFKGI